MEVYLIRLRNGRPLMAAKINVDVVVSKTAASLSPAKNRAYLRVVKTLYIARHAKSSWEDPDLEDFQRPLNGRGEKDAPQMGKRLHKLDVSPRLISSSPANRALATARHIAEALHYPSREIQEEQKLYHAGEETILDIVRSFDDKFDAAMIVGHNPGLTEFVNDLLNEEIGNIPTAGVVGGKLAVHSWKDVNWGCGKMIFFEYPKK